MSRWFRMYEEILDDPKVQRLSGDDFKAWVNLLCLASRNEGMLPCVADISFSLRLDEKKASATVSRLVTAGLLDQDGNGFSPHKWNARQYKSDVSTGRVKRFRERFKDVSETATETAPDTETDTDVSVTNVTGAEAPLNGDADKVFWDGAKAYLGKSKASQIGKWIKDHGKAETAAAISAAQVERAFDPISFIEGRFRKTTRNGYGAGHSGVPL